MQGLRVAGRSTLMLAVLALTVAGIACSSDDSKSSSSGSSAAKGAVNASGAITIVAKDNVYEPKEFTGPAGQKITVTVDNQGAAVHNFQVKDQPGANGQDIQTALVNAKQSGSVDFTLPAGTYDFFCSVHPVEMRGKITLQ